MVPTPLMLHLGTAAVRDRILSRIAAFSAGQRPRWGRMTAHGMVCHLCDSFRLPLGERTASPVGGPAAWAQRTVMKWGALYFPVRWPHGVATRPEMEQGVGGSAPVDFPADRAELTALVKRFAEPGRRFNGFQHPMFGPLTPTQWLRWGYLHADHHLRQFGV